MRCVRSVFRRRGENVRHVDAVTQVSLPDVDCSSGTGFDSSLKWTSNSVGHESTDVDPEKKAAPIALTIPAVDPDVRTGQLLLQLSRMCILVCSAGLMECTMLIDCFGPEEEKALQLLSALVAVKLSRHVLRVGDQMPCTVPGMNDGDATDACQESEKQHILERLNQRMNSRNGDVWFAADGTPSCSTGQKCDFEISSAQVLEAQHLARRKQHIKVESFHSNASSNSENTNALLERLLEESHESQRTARVNSGGSTSRNRLDGLLESRRTSRESRVNSGGSTTKNRLESFVNKSPRLVVGVYDSNRSTRSNHLEQVSECTTSAHSGNECRVVIETNNTDSVELVNAGECVGSLPVPTEYMSFTSFDSVFGADVPTATREDAAIDTSADSNASLAATGTAASGCAFKGVVPAPSRIPALRKEASTAEFQMNPHVQNTVTPDETVAAERKTQTCLHESYTEQPECAERAAAQARWLERRAKKKEAKQANKTKVTYGNHIRQIFEENHGD